MTRKDIRTAIDRLLGNSTSESVLRELFADITLGRRRRAAQHRPTRARDLIEILTGRSVTDLVLRRVRMTAAKTIRVR
jgi:hypothetical protein